MVGERDRLAFIDVARGGALVLMVVNHTARYWLDDSLGDARTALIHVTTSLAGPSFLFLVGFVLPISWAHARHRVAKYFLRAAQLVVAGYVLNAVAFPEQPLLTSNVLHTIAAAMLAGPLILPWLERPGARPALAGMAVLWVAVFWLMLPGIERWVADHPRAALVVFSEFPPWPWLGVVFLGIVVGSARRTAHRPALLIVALGVAGTAAVLGAVACWWADPRTLTFTRDVVINGHWVPRGAMTVWVLGAVSLGLAAAWWLTEVAGVRLPWLVVLGRTALALYVIHLLLVVNLVQHGLGVRLNGWVAFWAATTVLIAALVAIGTVWLAFRSALARRTAGGRPETRPARAPDPETAGAESSVHSAASQGGGGHAR
jgi:uncharacterized membrane protein